MSKVYRHTIRLGFLLVFILYVSNTFTQNQLKTNFKSAKGPAPAIIWQWMNGLVSKEGITADLEAFKEIGLSGVYNFQIGGSNQTLAEDSTIKIGNEKWKELMRYSIDECARLGLTFATHNCPGWSSSAAPYMKVEDSMQKLVWSEFKLSGPANNPIFIKQPKVDSLWNYYQDIALIAFPDQAVIPLESVLDLSSRMNDQGELKWNVPDGKWIILRFGHTTTGMTNVNTAPRSGVGLECDKMSRSAVKKFWDGYPAELLHLAGENAGKSFNRIEIDSYEAGSQNWTPQMPTEFKRLRGYELLRWMPVLAGKTVENKDQSGRFKLDMKRTISDLYADNYYLYMDKLTRETPGIELLLEPYTGPFDTYNCSGGESQLACEFWTRPGWGWNTVLPVASAAHTLGKKIVSAESFTCWPLSAWQDGPYELKAVGDRAFCMGVNQLLLHAAAHNPWVNAKPGMSFGKWGTQFQPGQTWWKHGGKEWIEYLTRCQTILQKGLFVGDICYLNIEGNKSKARPEGYAGDECGERVFLTRMTVENGKLTLPDGMSYQVLVLPESNRITLAVARKLGQLVKDGAILIGPKPLKSIGLGNYPSEEQEIRKIGEEVWGKCDGNKVKELSFGKGKVFWGVSETEVLRKINLEPDLSFSNHSDIQWIHRKEGDTDIYFISNQKDEAKEIIASFRISGKEPELWHADTGETEQAPYWSKNGKRTDLLLSLDPRGSVFVVFTRETKENGPGLQKKAETLIDNLHIDGPWKLQFNSQMGAPESIAMDTLKSCSENTNQAVKYFSGTASYIREIHLSDLHRNLKSRIILDLGVVKNIAEVFVNGKSCGTLWKPPFRADISNALKTGDNHLEIRVTNLWPNRMIGDEQEPDDAEWGEPFHYSYAPGNPYVGKMLAKEPQWLKTDQPRPSQGRYTFVSFKFFTKDSKLLPSGLLGPVNIIFYE